LKSETRNLVSLLLNLGILPGSGNFLLKKYLSGTLQLLISLTAVVLATIGAYQLYLQSTPEDPLPHGPILKIVYSLLLFLTSWVWAGVQTIATFIKK